MAHSKYYLLTTIFLFTFTLVHSTVTKTIRHTSQIINAKNKVLRRILAFIRILRPSIKMEGDSSSTSDNGLKIEGKFYQEGAEYWAKVEPTVNGMLGGLGYLNNIDIKDSDRFLKGILKDRKELGTSQALDCGAGIGRITKNLLTRFFDKVDLVDQDPKFIEEAKNGLSEHPKVGQFYCSGLQEFKPEEKKYDVIWMQWVLSHLTDEDLKGLLKRCGAALKPGGIIIIKENTTKGESKDEDDEDSSITRPFKGFMNVFSDAGVKVLKYVKQKNFPTELYPVWIFALDPNPPPPLRL